MAAPLNPTPASLAEDAVVKPPWPDHSIETPSGKWSGGENFPVGSWLLPARLRPHVMAFYGFARAADDIAVVHVREPKSADSILQELRR